MVYCNQDISDVSFCFDEIPVEKMNGVDNSTIRTNISSKVFNQYKFEECAYKTAQNVKEQIDTLRNSKVSYIIQGNTFKDMIRWFEIGAKVLGDDIKKLHGIAVAGTCMGNGELETCDMIFAASQIFDKYPDLNKHIHFLGFGSAKRLLPAILMINSGLLKDVTISSDSSSQSITFLMGNIVSFDKKLTAQQSYEIFVSDLKSVFDEYCDHIDVVELSEYITKYNRTRNDLNLYFLSQPNHKYHYICSSIYTLYNIWATTKLFYQLDIMYDSTSYISLLKNVKTHNDYIHWRSKNYSNLQSKRLIRKRKTFI